MSNKNYLNPARYVRSKCAIFCLPINARNAIAFSNYNCYNLCGAILHGRRLSSIREL